MKILSFGFIAFLFLTSETHGQDIDSSLVYGGSKRGDFKKTLLELRETGLASLYVGLGHMDGPGGIDSNFNGQ